ncbi:hypothetical protein WA026_021081 [Henosepilachna vigintioctopunctata]|uniref:Uncharacterized protein n=1 Tax=Henosepilachna vigintioctopunctata TaxID=420089 RepID=A0AAW1V1B9_9CUCU
METTMHETNNTQYCHKTQLHVKMKQVLYCAEKFAKPQVGRTFLLNCKHQQLCPVFSTLKIKHITFQSQHLGKKFENTLGKFTRNTINLLITDTTKQINELTTGINREMENMMVLSERDTARDLEQQICSEITSLRRKYQTTHNRKLNNSEKTTSKEGPKNVHRQHNREPDTSGTTSLCNRHPEFGTQVCSPEQ